MNIGVKAAQGAAALVCFLSTALAVSEEMKAAAESVGNSLAAKYGEGSTGKPLYTLRNRKAMRNIQPIVSGGWKGTAGSVEVSLRPEWGESYYVKVKFTAKLAQNENNAGFHVEAVEKDVGAKKYSTYGYAEVETKVNALAEEVKQIVGKELARLAKAAETSAVSEDSTISTTVPKKSS